MAIGKIFIKNIDSNMTDFRVKEHVDRSETLLLGLFQRPAAAARLTRSQAVEVAPVRDDRKVEISGERKFYALEELLIIDC